MTGQREDNSEIKKNEAVQEKNREMRWVQGKGRKRPKNVKIIEVIYWVNIKIFYKFIAGDKCYDK